MTECRALMRARVMQVGMYSWRIFVTFITYSEMESALGRGDFGRMDRQSGRLVRDGACRRWALDIS